MFKNPETGNWEHDFRIESLPRYRAIYGPKKEPATRLHGVAVALFKARDPRLIHAMKRGAATLEQFAQLRESGRPFADALAKPVNVEPWPTFAEAVEQYIAALDANENKSEGTRRTAATQLNRALLSIDPDARLDTITSKRVTDYQSELIAKDYEPNTVTAYVWRIGSLFQWFIRREAIAAREENRAARTLYVPIDPETVTTARTKRNRYLSPVEAERLLAATPAGLLFPVASGLFAGFRVDEMIHLRPGFDVDLELGTLAVQAQPGWKPKTKHSHRHVPIASALRPILEAQLADRASEEWVTPSFRDPSKPLNKHTFEEHFARIVEDAEMIAGRTDPNGVTFHTLRHTFASWLLMRGVDLYTVAQLLGNTVNQVEGTYGHLSRDHRKAAVDRLSDVALLPRNNATPSATMEPV